MIEVTELTRSFSGFTAVDGISFSVKKGEIVGFLGPNGAGKTTTLRMLTGFLPPTAGRARIAGFDIVDRSLDARRNIGYLPESVPLYGDMRVEEYLRFRARLKGVARKDVPGRIDVVTEKTRVADVRGKMIGHLSKGYRQRVGMADALIHDPPILFFDEPTSGLDPNQIHEVRELIADLGREKTLMISTHILPEVEATCKRVIIINKGRIVADDEIGALRTGGQKGMRLFCSGTGAPLDTMRATLRELPGLRSVKDRDEGLEIIADSEAVLGAISSLFAKRGWTLTELRPDRRRLEEVFWRVTGFEVNPALKDSVQEEARP